MCTYAVPCKNDAAKIRSWFRLRVLIDVEGYAHYNVCQIKPIASQQKVK